MSGISVVPEANQGDADAAQLARFGYGQELKRVLNLFENFAVAFCYISPVVGIYSLFVLGVGTAGPRYIWLMPIVVVGQLFVALVFAELGSHYPIAGALFQWGKNLIGPGYGWWVGWIYGWALIMTVASVDTGFVIYAGPLLNNLFHTSFNPADPNQILIFTIVLILVQLAFNVGGVNFLGRISQIGVYFEIIGTFGIAILLAITGFHHDLGYLFSSQGAENVATNPLGVDFGGNWWLGAAFVAILAHVYIFYGFESAGDVAEEVVQASRRVPRAIISSLITAGITSFVLVAALLLTIPAGKDGLANTVSGGVPFLIGSNVSGAFIQDLALFVVCFAFFSCGLAIQAAAARVIYSYSRDRALPASTTLARVSPRFRTPANALIVAAIVPALFAVLARFTPSSNISILFITIPAHVNALFLLVSFAVSGIYLAFLLVVLAALIARLRGWRPEGSFKLGKWALPVMVAGLVWLTAMLVNILLPSGVSSPRGALFNYDWMTLIVVVVIVALGALYSLFAHPARRIQKPAAQADHS
ncbi:MAG TPA: amino acid permease [Candidatus Saccharimonadales bacterium]|nr:amino acid permease [Candidatus Saccharimonadales bacterium]